MTHPADRALQIAVEMEKLGQTFYQSLAEGCADAAIAALARQLANAEKQHVEIFGRMLAALPQGLRGPKLTDEELFAAAGELRVKVMPGPAKVRAAVLVKDLPKTLDMAIEMEAQAVSFYTGEALTASGMDSAALSRIVEEEKKHLAVLREQRNRIRPA